MRNSYITSSLKLERVESTIALSNKGKELESVWSGSNESLMYTTRRGLEMKFILTESTQNKEEPLMPGPSKSSSLVLRDVWIINGIVLKGEEKRHHHVKWFHNICFVRDGYV